jgi:hypothetical protein
MKISSNNNRKRENLLNLDGLSSNMNKPHPHHFLLRAESTLADWWREKQERRMSENERYRPRGLDDADEG